MHSAPNWKKVGKIKDYHGLRGDLSVHIFSKDISWIDELESFAVGKDGEEPILVFINEKAKPFKEGLMIKPEGVVDRTAAEKLGLKGQMFYVPEELVDEPEDDLMGFVVCDENEQRLGTVSGFVANNFQELMLLEKSNGQVSEIPFVDEFILNIDDFKKEITVRLPEGLLEINE